MSSLQSIIELQMHRRILEEVRDKINHAYAISSHNRDVMFFKLRLERMIQTDINIIEMKLK